MIVKTDFVQNLVIGSWHVSKLTHDILICRNDNNNNTKKKSKNLYVLQYRNGYAFALENWSYLPFKMVLHLVVVLVQEMVIFH